MLRRIFDPRIILLLLIALAIRLAGIASRPIWYDEAFSILISAQSPGTILNSTLSPDADASAAEEHPPAYYLMLWGWMQVFGNSLIAVRALSILAGVGIVLVVYLIGRHLFNQSTALAAGLLAAILPFQVHFSQEIRMYVFLALWLSLATYAFLRRQWVWFAVFAALAQYSHNLAVIHLIPLALTPVFQKDWRTLRSVILAGFASIVLYLPWLVHLPAQFAKIHNGFWVEKPGVEKIFTLFLFYLPNLPLPGGWLLPGLLIAALVITLAGYQTFRARRFHLDSDSGLSEKREQVQVLKKGIWPAYLAFAPPIFLWLISQFQPIYVERALLPSHVMFCLWLAWALTQTVMPRPIQATAFALVLISSLMGLYQHVTFAGFPYAPYAALDQSLSQRNQAGDVIIHSSKLSCLPSIHFDDRLSQRFITDPTGSATDTLSPATMQTLSLNAAEDVESAAADARRVWLVIFRQSIEEMKAQGLATHPHLEYLETNFKLESVEDWDDLQVYLFVRSTP
jgi:hypothetical protein